MPKQIILEDSSNIDAIFPTLQHGDMIFKPGFLRSGGVFFVQTLDENGNSMPTTLIQKDDTGAAYYSIPLAITLHFADPVKEYLPLLENKKMGVRKTDWEAIEIDTTRHQLFIEESTGGKSIASNRLVKYFINHPDHGRGLFIYNPLTPEEKLNVWMKLSKTIDPKYLGSSVYYLTEEDIRKTQLKNKKIYETKFQKWLRTLKKGDNVDICNIPKDINNRYNEGTMSSSVIFLKIEEGSGPLTVWAEKHDYLLNNLEGAQAYTATEITFTPSPLSDIGPFGGVLFWLNKDEDRMLDVPIWNATFKNL